MQWVAVGVIQEDGIWMGTLLGRILEVPLEVFRHTCTCIKATCGGERCRERGPRCEVYKLSVRQAVRLLPGWSSLHRGLRAV